LNTYYSKKIFVHWSFLFKKNRKSGGINNTKIIPKYTYRKTPSAIENPRARTI